MQPCLQRTGTSAAGRHRGRLQDSCRWSLLCQKACLGDFMAIVGAPNCRTWSLRGGPSHGWQGPAACGLADFWPSENVDRHSSLLLSMLLLYQLALEAGQPPAFLLEHPENPQNVLLGGPFSSANTSRMRLLSFDPAHFSAKPTSVLPNLAVDWDGLRCKHTSHPTWWNSSDLALWVWQMNTEIAEALENFFFRGTEGDPDRAVA